MRHKKWTPLSVHHRKLNPADAQVWAQLDWEHLKLVRSPLARPFRKDFNTLVETAIDRLKINEDSAFFGAFVNDVLVGTVGIHRDDGQKERHKCLLVSFLSLRKSTVRHWRNASSDAQSSKSHS